MRRSGHEVSRWRARLLGVAVWLAVGVAATIGLAQIPALTGFSRPTMSFRSGSIGSSYRFDEVKLSQGAFITWFETRTFDNLIALYGGIPILGSRGLTADRLDVWSTRPPRFISSLPEEDQIGLACGWPWRGMVAFVQPPTGTGPGPLKWNVSGGFLLNTPSANASILDLRIVPLRPIWPEFIANSLLLALLGFATMAVWKHLRSYRRLLLGVCPRCGYELLGNFSAGCNECGWRKHPDQPGRAA